MTTPKVSVIILNYKGLGDTIECVQAVRRSDYPSLEIVLVDNASADGSAEALRCRFSGVRFIENRENLGYAGGNNVGIRAAFERGADYVFVLNNEAVPVRNTVSRLVASAEKNPRATILAPQVLFYDHPDTVNSLGTRMDWFRLRPHRGACGQARSASLSALPREREILPGSALFFTKKLFAEVGLFDERYFLIHEDAELCLRNRRKGHVNLVVPDAVVYHKTSRTLSSYPYLTDYYSLRNFLYLDVA